GLPRRRCLRARSRHRRAAPRRRARRAGHRAVRFDFGLAGRPAFERERAGDHPEGMLVRALARQGVPVPPQELHGPDRCGRSQRGARFGADPMKRTVAHLVPDHNPFPPGYAAGTELRVEQVARRQRRYRPVVVCGWFEGQAEIEEQGPMRIRRIRIGPLYRRLFRKITRLDPLPYTERMWRIAREEGAGILHIHNEPKLLAGLAARLQQAAAPVVVHVANEKVLPKHAVGRVTRWVACSRYIRDWLTGENGIAAERVQVIYTGVDAAARKPRWEVPTQVREALRRRFGVADPSATALSFAGRLVKEKGVNELLDAFERLRARHGSGIELLVAGNVRDSDDPKNEKAVYGKAVTARMAKMPGVRWVGSLRPVDM